MSEPKSTPLGGDEPTKSEPQGPIVKLPAKQLHDPDAPENLLKSDKPLTAADLTGKASAADLAEIEAAEKRLAKEAADMRSADAPSAPIGLPEQPQVGAPPRTPAVTDLESNGEGREFDRRTLPASRRSLEMYQPPLIPIKDEDLERMLECIIHNKHYSERFKKGPVEVLFRVKSAKEVDYQRANLSKQAADGAFGLMSDFQAAIARYNQLFEVVEYNGKQVSPVKIPPRPWKNEDLNLEEQYWASWLSDVTESAGYMIHGLMIQFEDKVYRMQQMMLDPDFTMPVAPSSSARD